MQRDRLLAYNTACLVGFSKVPPFEECFPPKEEEQPTSKAKPGAYALLGHLFKLKASGIEMKIERVTLH